MSALHGPLIAMLALGGLAQAQTPASPAGSSAAVATPVKATAHHRAHKPKEEEAKPSAPAASAALDLHAPPLSHIYPRQDLAYILAYNPDNDVVDGEVSVRGSKSGYNVPVSPGNQLQAIPWALFHPTEAWRILTPVEAP